MKFRVRRATAVPEIDADPMEESLALARENPGREDGRWSTALLMVGSALVGATAIAFWNRKTIAEMRTHMQAAAGKSTPAKPPEEDTFQ